MIAVIRKVPLPLSALALGLAALGNLLAPYSPAVRLVCGAAAAAVAALVLLRLVLDATGVAAELENAAVLGVLPTLFMALMLLATYLKPYSAEAATALWFGAMGAQAVVVVFFVVRFVTGFSLKHVFPCWFVVFVGFVAASVTSPAFGMQPLGRALLYAGLVGYLAVLPVVVVRMRRSPLPIPVAPTVAIFAAPVSLCLVGYLAVIEAKQPAVVYGLLAVAVASLLYALANVPSILKAGFSPGYAALTFPLVITAIAVKQSAAFLGTIPAAVVVVMDVLATVTVVFVAASFVTFLWGLTRPARAEAPA